MKDARCQEGDPPTGSTPADVRSQLAGIFALNSFLGPSSIINAEGTRQATQQTEEQPFEWMRLLFLTAARANHSCRPNVYFRTALNHSSGTSQIELRALKGVASGHELLIDYTAGRPLTRSRRRSFLQDRWHFTCQCEVCAGDGSKPPSVMHERRVVDLAALLARDGRPDNADHCSHLWQQDRLAKAAARGQLDAMATEMRAEHLRSWRRAELYGYFGSLQHQYYEYVSVRTWQTGKASLVLDAEGGW